MVPRSLRNLFIAFWLCSKSSGHEGWNFCSGSWTLTCSWFCCCGRCCGCACGGFIWEGAAAATLAKADGVTIFGIWEAWVAWAGFTLNGLTTCEYFGQTIKMSYNGPSWLFPTIGCWLHDLTGGGIGACTWTGVVWWMACCWNWFHWNCCWGWGTW